VSLNSVTELLLGFVIQTGSPSAEIEPGALDDGVLVTVVGVSTVTVVVATAPVPASVVAYTEMVYVVPLARPVMVQEVPVVVLQVCPLPADAV
jgi:hypothetical protein